MDTEEALDLGQHAIEKVSRIATFVGQKKQRIVCGRLGAELFILADYLQGLSDQVDQLLKVPKLLRDIERICCWPEKPKDDYCPCLRSIANSIYGTNAYRQAEASIIKGLTKITAGSGEEAEKAILHIRRFTKRGGIKKQKTEEITTSKSMPVDHLDDAKKLVYQTLRKHVRCTCDCDLVDKREHSANLLLSLPSDDQDSALFNMLFSSDPSRDRLMTGRWQDVQLSVVNSSKSQKKRQKRARFDENIDYNERCSEEVKDGKFCNLIRQGDQHARLCLTVHDGKLHRLLDSQPLQHIIDHTPGISLANVIQSYYLTPKVKAILGYILARSVWQFYGSDWLKTPWTSRTIHFMKHYNSPLEDEEPSIFASKPYYSVHFGEEDASVSEATTNSGEIHRYPRVRDLGIMLVEIGLGCLLDDSAPKNNVISKANQDWLHAKGWSDTKGPWRDFDYPKYRAAVENCLDPNIFAKAPFTPSVNADELAKGLHKRRKIFYEHVVAPLEELVQGTGWKDIVNNMPSLRMQTTTTRQPKSLEEIGIPVEQSKLSKDQQDAKRWIRRVQLLNKELKSARQAPVRRVRIAILDTGYDPDAVFFQPNLRRNRLAKWKDFVEDAREPTDCNGHGTHLVSLVMKVAPEADIYVARVARDAVGLTNASEAIAKAIEWASEHDANIISMSFGFPDKQASISKAIREAVNDHDDSIIFFAAAANSGLNQAEMFPARHECVISIRATNSNGAFQDFNPPRNGVAVGTLGLDVPSSGLSHEVGDVYRKGTSIATAVAAGIAGMLLGYIESNAGRSTYGHVRKRAQTREGMLKLFEIISPVTDDGQIYVAPWEIEQPDDDRRWAKLGALV